MSRAAQISATQRAPETSNLLLQRKCACGSEASAFTGECEECRKTKLFGPQTKLTVSSVDDPLEREADRVADEIMRRPVPLLVRRHEEDGRPRLQTQPSVQENALTGRIRSMAAPPSVWNVLRSAGQPLGRTEREFFEPRFGHDFGQVRVHTGARAEASARELHASAYTVGRHIVFASGQHAPATPSGQRLLAHELTHVVQQGGGDLRLAGFEPTSYGRSPHYGLQRRRSQDEVPPNESCQTNPDYGEELRKVDRFRNTLKRWLKSVGRRDLRFDLLRKLRSRRARRICLAAGCGDPDFQAAALDGETLKKLACFDEAQGGGSLQGVCGKLLDAHCPTGPAPPAPRKRAGRVGEILQSSGHAQAAMIGGKDALEAELIQTRERLRLAIGDLRILEKDRSDARAAGTKLSRRSRPADAFFADAFGTYNTTKATDVQAILGHALKLIEGGKVKVVVLSPEPSVDAATPGCPREPGELAQEFRHCHGPCTQAEPLCSDPWWTCIQNCTPTPSVEAEDSTDGTDALTEAASAEPTQAKGAPAGPTVPEPEEKTDATPIWWASQNSDPDCSAASGYYSPAPEPGGRIGLCVDDAEQGRISGELDRMRLRATLLHELFHKVLGEADVDVYTSSQLFPLLKDLQEPVRAPAHEGEVQPKDPTLALRNPDSLVRFVMRTSRVDTAEAERALPTAGKTPDAGTCEVDRAQYALGIAHQWLRWGQVTLATAKANRLATDAQVRQLATIEKLMRLLGEAGKDKAPLGKNITVYNPPSVPPSFVQPATLNVRVQGTTVVLHPKGSRVELTVPQTFFAQTRKVQIRQVLSALGASDALIRFLETNQGLEEDAAVLLSAREPSSCRAGSGGSD